LKAAAAELAYPQLDHGIDFTNPANCDPSAIQAAESIISAMQYAQNNDLGGWDIDGVNFKDQLDYAAYQHDVDMRYGTWEEEQGNVLGGFWDKVVANETYAGAAFSNFLNTGDVYSLGATAVIGLGGVAKDAWQAIGYGLADAANAIGSFVGWIEGLFAPSDPSGSALLTFSSDCYSTASCYETYDGNYGAGGYADAAGYYAYNDYYDNYYWWGC
jgi:hypothetical protein